MKKSKFLIITAILVIVTITAALFAGCVKKAMGAEGDLDFDGLASAPTQEARAKAQPVDKSKITLSDTMTEDQAVLDSIEYLLRLSNKNIIESDFFAAAAYGNGEATVSGGIVGSMETREVRIFDNDTYYFDSYGLIVDGYTVKSDGSHGEVNDMLLGALAKALNFTKRVYSPNNADFYYSENGASNENSIVNFPDQNAVVYQKPKATKLSFDEYVKKTNSRENYKGFTTDNYDNDKPITAGLLKYDESTGIYYLECDINTQNNTLELSVADMLDNGAIKEFVYAKKHLTIEIWDCGLIRTYINSNVWNASMIMNLKGSSVNYYEQWFTYDKSKLDKMNISDDLKNALMN
ncbi:MAG: hypothetical protein K2L53_03805 [Clostridia bacterium]|nr:hypothetical protein [Clostridia bacterium]